MTGLRELVEAVPPAEPYEHGDHGGAFAADCGFGGLCARCHARIDLADAITPDVLAAVEAHPDAMEALAAVRRLGEARAAKRTAQDAESAASDSFYSARARGEPSDGLDALRAETGRANKAHAVAHDAWAAANSTLCALADRLAARKGE